LAEIISFDFVTAIFLWTVFLLEIILEQLVMALQHFLDATKERYNCIA
jgi:hypothetical protein